MALLLYTSLLVEQYRLERETFVAKSLNESRLIAELKHFNE